MFLWTKPNMKFGLSAVVDFLLPLPEEEGREKGDMLFSNRGERSNSVSHSQGQGQKGQQWFQKPYTRKDRDVKLCIMPHVWHIPLTASAVSMLCWSKMWRHEMMPSGEVRTWLSNVQFLPQEQLHVSGIAWLQG